MSRPTTTRPTQPASRPSRRRRDYDDIIELERPASRKAAMPIRDRAAQFSPFAALTGHRESLAEAQQRMIERMNTDNREEDPFGESADTIDMA